MGMYWMLSISPAPQLFQPSFPSLIILVVILCYCIKYRTIKEEKKKDIYLSWLTLLNMTVSSCIHVPAKVITLFFMAENNFTVRMYHIFVIHFSVRCLYWLHSLAVASSFFFCVYEYFACMYVLKLCTYLAPT